MKVLINKIGYLAVNGGWGGRNDDYYPYFKMGLTLEKPIGNQLTANEKRLHEDYQNAAWLEIIVKFPFSCEKVGFSQWSLYPNHRVSLECNLVSLAEVYYGDKKKYSLECLSITVIDPTELPREPRPPVSFYNPNFKGDGDFFFILLLLFKKNPLLRT